MTSYTQKMVDLSLALTQHRQQRNDIEQRIAALVKAAREEGMTWAMIGSALYVSAQAAWERYGLTPEEKAARSRQNRPEALQDTLEGLDLTRDERIAARKLALKQKRGKATEE